MFASMGGVAQMGEGMKNGMVLTMSMWTGDLNWLDSCKKVKFLTIINTHNGVIHKIVTKSIHKNISRTLINNNFTNILLRPTHSPPHSPPAPPTAPTTTTTAHPTR